MSIRCIIFLLLLLTLGWGRFADNARAADALNQFETGNKLYEERKFGEAGAVYQQIVNSGQASPALYFNLGNAHFKSGKTGLAIIAYRRAEQLTPRDPDIRANLQFARNQVQGPTLRPTRWQRLLGTLSLNEWAGLSVGGFWLTFALLAAVQFRPAWKSSLRNATLVAGGGTLIQDIPSQIIGAMVHTYSDDTPRDYVAHTVRVQEGTRLASILGTHEVAVNSWHHQSCDVPGQGLVYTAWAFDGVVEGAESPGHRFAVAVQWHPEEMFHNRADMLALFRALVQAA